ncbi:MAG: extensin family protein [Aestuariivirgaceae bacterium]
MKRRSTIGFAFLLSCMIAAGAVSGVTMIPPRAPLPPETIDVTPQKRDALTASLSKPRGRAEVEAVIIPASTNFRQFPDELEPTSRSDSLLAPKPVPVPRLKPFGQLKLAMAGSQDMIFVETDVDTGLALPRLRSYGNWPKSSVTAARERCEKVLRGLEVELKAKDPIGDSKGCGIAYPVSVSKIAGVRLTPAATVNCGMVAALHRWITDIAQPAAKREFGTRLVGLQIASSYACRRRNSAATGKLSEHAIGNAIDIADFRFSNRVEASVAGGWNGASRGLSITNRGSFLKSTRKGACTYFNTVLGPGADPFHKDHYHLDLMKLRPGRGKYCR